jgi:mannose-1-phosphate guanylyltransferase
MGIRYSLEHSPLGTAGPIRLASTIARLPTTFIAMNGDVITNIRLDEMLEKHEISGATVTDALCRVKDPSRFGVVEMSSASRILRFIEKPKKNAPSRLINAGVYLIDRNLLKMIPPNRKVSLEREIFPTLAAHGRLNGFPISGYWFDIGNLSDYRRANFELMQKTMGMSILRRGRSMIASDSKVTAPSIIGLDSKISRGTKLGPNVVSGRHLRLGRRVKVMNSILFDNVEVGDESSINGAIVGSNVLIGERVRVATGTILSPGVNVHDDIRIGKRAIIHPYLEVIEDVRSFAQLM